MRLPLRSNITQYGQLSCLVYICVCEADVNIVTLVEKPGNSRFFFSFKTEGLMGGYRQKFSSLPTHRVFFLSPILISSQILIEFGSLNVCLIISNQFGRFAYNAWQ